jgi:hypothetical protein
MLKNVEDEITWLKNKAFGNYTSKLGYEVRMEDVDVGENKWWWRSI